MYNRFVKRLLGTAAVVLLAATCYVGAKVDKAPESYSTAAIVDATESVYSEEAQTLSDELDISIDEPDLKIESDELELEQLVLSPVQAGFESAVEVNSEWAGKAISTASDYVNIRSEASLESDVVGLFRSGNIGDVVDYEDGWYRISSGNVEGYVSGAYVATGSEVSNYVTDESVNTYAYATDHVRIRQEPNTSSYILRVCNIDDKLSVIPELSVEGWVAVDINGSTFYVCDDYVALSEEYEYTSAVTLDEQQQIEQEEIRIAQEAREASDVDASNVEISDETQISQTYVTNAGSIPATYDEVVLMAAIIQLEAGGESYTGQVAVGAVIINRLKSSQYPDTISGVIYQKNQFETATFSSLPSIMQSPRESCMQAAYEALAGADPTGGCLSFRASWTGHSGYLIGNQVFF